MGSNVNSAAGSSGFRPAATLTRSPAPEPWPLALAFAFLGGLILNVMPCVFPVLAIKAGALARLSGCGTQAVRVSALPIPATGGVDLLAGRAAAGSGT